MPQVPIDQHITYQKQFRKCGKPTCTTCRSGQGHGPYWYAYWREGSRLRSGYIGKVHPDFPGISADALNSDRNISALPDIAVEEPVAALA